MAVVVVAVVVVAAVVVVVVVEADKQSALLSLELPGVAVKSPRLTITLLQNSLEIKC